MTVISSLLVKLGIDNSGVTTGLAASQAKFDSFARSAQKSATTVERSLGRPLDRAGIEAANGWVTGVDGRLRNAQGQFVSAGDQAAAGLMQGLSTGSGRRFPAFVGKLNMLMKTGGLAAAAGVGLFVKTSIGAEAQFSQTMNTVAAATGRAGKGLEDLQQLALDLGASTTFSANDAAEAMLELAKGGLSAATIQAGALEGTLMLAAAGGTDMATAATIASNAMNAFSLGGKKMDSVAAALAGGANASSATVESLGQALAQVGPGAVNAGMSLQETVGALSAFDAAGIKGSDAGTSLKTMLARLIPQTDKANKAMEQLGLDFVKGNGSFESLTNIAGQLQDKLGGLSAAQRSAALTTIFGSDASRAATVLMREGSTGIRDFIKATRDKDAAQKMADARMKGTAGAIENFKGALETAQISLGLLIQPYAVKAIDGLTAGVNRAVPAIQTFFAQMKSGTGVGGGFVDVMSATAATVGTVGKFLNDHRTLVAGVVAAYAGFKIVTTILAAYRAAMVFVTAVQVAYAAASYGAVGATYAQGVASKGAVVGMIAQKAAMVATTVASGAMTAAQWALNAAMTANPIGLIVLAIVALVAAFVVAYKKSETFRAIVDAALNGVKAAASAVASFFTQKIPAAWDAVVGATQSAWGKVKAVTSAVWGFISGYVKTQVGIALAVLNGISKVPGIVRDAFETARSAVVDKLKAIVNLAKGLPDRVLDGVGDLGSTLYDVGTDLISGLINGIKNKAGDLVSTIQNFVIDKIPGPVRKALGIFSPSKVMMKVGEFTVDGLIKGIENRVGAVESTIDKMTDRISKLVDDKKMTKAAGKAAQGIVDAFDKKLGKKTRAFENWKTRIEEARGELDKMVSDRESMASGLSGSLTGELDLGSLVSEPNQFGFGGNETTFGAVAGAVARIATRVRNFAGLLRRLLAAGIPKGLVQEVASLGSVKGAAVANALLSGSSAQVKQLAIDYSSFTSAADEAGNILGGAFFDVGLKAQQGIIAGLLSEGAGLQEAIDKLGDRLVKKMKKKFKIKSPSQLMADEIGVPSGQGVAVGLIGGLDSAQSDIDARMAALASVPSAGSVDLTRGASDGAASSTGGMSDADWMAWIEQLLENLGIEGTFAIGDRDAARLYNKGKRNAEAMA